MGSCKIKKGIFIQRTCSRPTSVTCDSCSIEVCNHHYRQSDQGLFCFTCASKSEKRSEHHEDEPLHFDGNYYWWYWNTRSYYYSDYSDAVYFDEQDYDGFDTSSYEGYDNMEDNDDFFDS